MGAGLPHVGNGHRDGIGGEQAAPLFCFLPNGSRDVVRVGLVNGAVWGEIGAIVGPSVVYCGYRSPNAPPRNVLSANELCIGRRGRNPPYDVA